MVTTNIYSWLDFRRSLNPMSVREISPHDCDPWVIKNHVLSRPDRRYFEGFIGLGQGWIRQPEIGTLGFLVSSSRNSRRVLLQLKEEPGNIGLSQIAPTVQATKSNREQVHRGLQQPYLSLFTGNQARSTVLQSSLHSEQGTRFWRKRNRNMLVETSLSVAEEQNHKWFPMTELRDALSKSYVVNTDSRSVLASSDWKIILESPPRGDNGKPPNGLLQEMSRQLHEDRIGVDGALKLLEGSRKSIGAVRAPVLKPSSPNKKEDSGFFWGRGAKGFRFFEVQAKFREIDSWRQPLFVSDVKPIHQLLVSRHRGSLAFLLNITGEPGLYMKAEYGPTVTTLNRGLSEQSDLNIEIACQLNDSAELIREIHQSDEGGRFFREEGTYRLVWVDPQHFLGHTPLAWATEQNGFCWVTPLGLNILCGTPMTTTNELRTLASLILS